jgi:hypothetical protein
MGRVVRGGLIQVRRRISLEDTTTTSSSGCWTSTCPLIVEAARRGQLLAAGAVRRVSYFCAEQQPR